MNVIGVPSTIWFNKFLNYFCVLYLKVDNDAFVCKVYLIKFVIIVTSRKTYLK